MKTEKVELKAKELKLIEKALDVVIPNLSFEELERFDFQKTPVDIEYVLRSAFEKFEGIIDKEDVKLMKEILERIGRPLKTSVDSEFYTYSELMNLLNPLCKTPRATHFRKKRRKRLEELKGKIMEILKANSLTFEELLEDTKGIESEVVSVLNGLKDNNWIRYDPDSKLFIATQGYAVPINNFEEVRQEKEKEQEKEELEEKLEEDEVDFQLLMENLDFGNLEKNSLEDIRKVASYLDLKFNERSTKEDLIRVIRDVVVNE
jgi:hypothetical protein